MRRRKELRSQQRLESFVSREASFLLNNWVFMALLVVVFWGTMFPVFSEALAGTHRARPGVLPDAFVPRAAAALADRRRAADRLAARLAAILRRQFALPARGGRRGARLLVVGLVRRAGSRSIC